MDDKDWIFYKWPNWLRWISALPLSIIASVVFTLLASLLINYYGYNADSGMAKTLIQYASIAGFLYIIFTCVPSFKEIITGIFSILISILAAVELVFYFREGIWFNWDCFIIFLVFIGCMYFGIMLFIDHGRIKTIEESNQRLIEKSENEDIGL